MSSFVVGVTGGIGSGKSMVTDRFQELGIEIVDADLASRAVVEPGKPALAEIADHFGAEILQADGGLDRALLRTKIFADAGEREWLEALLHPLINQQIEVWLAEAKSPYAVLVSPLLLEIGQDRYVHRILVVDVPVELQVQRTMARDDNSEEQVRAIIDSQTSREDRLARADDVILNDGDVASLHAAVDALHETYLAHAEKLAP